MPSVMDPEGKELVALAELVDFTGLHVLEVGVGEGRLTWRYARAAASVLGIDPDAERVALAERETPTDLAGRVHLRVQDATELDEPRGSFDLVFLSWSL